ncbi:MULTISPECIES: SMC family ATPase [unclassified Microbacterium]|uniref:AAA family ATPase n=1 Tax=unclassified Microbacterium TaxID=2609290 RepID=UPI00214C3703|nr:MULTISPECIES: SMC family ATPase [unclassified Microbacterium]MCR2783688.1 SMC family ATPase [Microbacterium sp. zg.B96]WIM15457.1 SMC family ATPase [Microbacterium sp. zg-B96]
MKLHRLELTGFGPFLSTQTVDFDAFARDGIFLISGRTGAGKSSILDGVSFALYGSVPRYESGDKRLRSDHCAPEDPTEVRLEFTVADRRWRVTRGPEYQRPARRGGGLTTEPTRAELEELVDGQWIGRAAKPRDVALALDEVLGLNAQQFQQVILLAQNKFSRFLLASGGERQPLLRTLFGTRRYEDYVRAIGERSKAALAGLDTLGEHARTLLDQAERVIAEHDLAGDAVAPTDLAGRRDAAERAVQRADYRVETLGRERADADSAFAAATTAHAARVALAKAHADLAQARERLASLENDAERIAGDRVTLERARAAEGIRSVLTAATRAAQLATAAAATAAAADRAWAQVAGDAEADVDLAVIDEQLTGDLAVWAAAARQEAELSAREAALATARERVARLERELATFDEQRALIPAERVRLGEHLMAARARAAVQGAARTQRDALAARVAAAREAETLAAALHDADVVRAAAAAASAAAGAAVAALLQRRLDGYAGELAAALVDGEACAVCGSTAHPRPATRGDEPVTDELVAAAEADRDAALAAERVAAETARSARDAHAQAAARAGGEPLEALETQLAAAADALTAAEAAQREAEQLDSRLRELDDLDAASHAARTACDADLGTARESFAALEATLTDTRQAVAAARGDYPTVAERIAVATTRRDAARACRAARAAAARAAEDLTAAVAERDAHLAASVFADPADATAALRDAGAVRELADRIGTHDTALAATRQRALELELELAGSTDEPVDLAASAAAVAAADAARAAAIAAERDAQNVAARLRDLVVQTDAAYAAVAAHAEEAEAVRRLADTVAGRAPNTMKMDLETFVLAAELEEIVAAANVRLEEMSSGRYTLHHSDARAARGAASGLGIDVLDAHTGQLRPPQSLSGGETFLASLALALGLAEVVTARAGGMRLDTLFIDEGFGSLDADTLELAMRTLDELRAGGRTVGVISHVEAMKEQLPAQLLVEATPRGPSLILQDEAVAAS